MARTVVTSVIADPASLTFDAIEAAFQPLRPQRLWPWQRCGVVLRTINHTKAWVAAYVKTEAEELDREFVTDDKYYTVHILNYEEKETRFVFRLRTRGLEGWTEYGIGVAKAGDDFACRE